MSAIISYDHKKRLMTFFIHHAPHRRAHRKVLAVYREMLWMAAAAAGITQQLTHDIGISVLFVDPTGPDLDNLTTALFQALDGKTGKGPTILADDRQIKWMEKMGLLFNQ